MERIYEELAQAMSVHQQRQRCHGHLGVTAVCGMAFLAGGHLPDRGPYATVIKRTHDYVISCALENGLLTDAGTRMYSHAFGTLFMAEIYGMAATEAAKTTLERAVNLIVDTQNAHGGWRYNPFDRETDLSVTVDMIRSSLPSLSATVQIPTEEGPLLPGAVPWSQLGAEGGDGPRRPERRHHLLPQPQKRLVGSGPGRPGRQSHQPDDLRPLRPGPQ